MVKKMGLKIKHRSLRYDINRPKPRHGSKYTKYKMCLSIMMVICIKQHLSNMKNLSNTEAELEKSVAYKKNVYFRFFSIFTLIFHFYTPGK